MKKTGLKYSVVTAVVIWGLVIAGGWIVFSRYENTPGRAPAAPAHWPAASRISLVAGMPTLVMFLHPYCPCSQASVGELELIMTHCRNKANTQVLFVKPPGMSLDWTKTPLWRRASAIPGVHVQIDEGGREANIFNATTSGQTMLYDPRGFLAFSGGITLSRGHSGDNDGRDGVESFLNTGRVTVQHTPFFGCLLLNPPNQTHKGACCVWKHIKKP